MASASETWGRAQLEALLGAASQVSGTALAALQPIFHALRLDKALAALQPLLDVVRAEKLLYVNPLQTTSISAHVLGATVPNSVASGAMAGASILR